MKFLVAGPVLAIAASFAAQAQGFGREAKEDYNVYFTKNPIHITPAAKNLIANIVREYVDRDDVAFIVTGHTDTESSRQKSLLNSAWMANIVAEELERLGANPNSILVFAHGESDLAKATADGVSEPLNRRVRLRIFVRE